ncbi:hypothetical protein [Singulisphaera acidiphila]|uniref:Uncharacterized protein n=1 Tax=Singulisphaera acidiphila (strain ATCC BAA-1392 / DSM 18658 / VKM B-2454 / MOB10) TaxID=886293 RepID=L0DHK6_SINAD|nr:hypothetical protein [Singulisphaera acidiphila]AGA28166.1 hypothetical protein Sinac_3938 [Singulisphaera acidiphila DSM 18658]
MTVSRKVLSLAVLVGGWSILSPTFAEAKTRPNVKNQKALRALVSARQTESLSPDLGFGSVTLPLNQRQVNQFLNNYFRQPNARISASLRANPYSAEANARRAFALEVFRERAMLKISGIAGGVFFSPPAGTPYYPVAANNFLQRLPIFRVLGIF